MTHSTTSRPPVSRRRNGLQSGGLAAGAAGLTGPALLYLQARYGLSPEQTTLAITAATVVMGGLGAVAGVIGSAARDEVHAAQQSGERMSFGRKVLFGALSALGCLALCVSPARAGELQIPYVEPCTQNDGAEPLEDFAGGLFSVFKAGTNEVLLTGAVGASSPSGCQGTPENPRIATIQDPLGELEVGMRVDVVGWAIDMDGNRSPPSNMLTMEIPSDPTSPDPLKLLNVCLEKDGRRYCAREVELQPQE